MTRSMKFSGTSAGRLDGAMAWLATSLLALVFALSIRPANAQSTELVTTVPSASEHALSLGQASAFDPLGADEIALEASRWGITEEDYMRYLEAMRGLRGHLSGPGITPIEVLGTEAQTPAERRKYAEIWVEAINADTEKVLAFSNAVHEAWQRLHPAASMIDRGRINELRAQAGALEAPLFTGARIGQVLGRLMLFTRTSCHSCDGAVKDLVARTAEGEFDGLDIYVVDLAPGENEAIQAWARRVGLPVDLMSGGHVTLNYDNGAFATVSDAIKSTPANWPVAIHRTGSGFEQVSLDH